MSIRSMLILCSYISMFLFVLPAPSMPSSKEGRRAEAYLLEWNFMKRMPITQSELKENYHYKYVEKDIDRLAKILVLLDKGGFPVSAGDLKIEGHLLVEIYYNDVKTKTYFGDRYRLCLIEKSACRSINSEFKEEVADLFVKYGEKSQWKIHIDEVMRSND